MKKLFTAIVCILFSSTSLMAQTLFEDVTNYNPELIVTDFCGNELPDIVTRKAINPSHGMEIIIPPKLFDVINACDPEGVLRPLINKGTETTDIGVISFPSQFQIKQPLVIIMQDPVFNDVGAVIIKVPPVNPVSVDVPRIHISVDKFERVLTAINPNDLTPEVSLAIIRKIGSIAIEVPDIDIAAINPNINAGDPIPDVDVTLCSKPPGCPPKKPKAIIVPVIDPIVLGNLTPDVDGINIVIKEEGTKLGDLTPDVDVAINKGDLINKIDLGDLTPDAIVIREEGSKPVVSDLGDLTPDAIVVSNIDLQNILQKLGDLTPDAITLGDIDVLSHKLFIGNLSLAPTVDIATIKVGGVMPQIDPPSLQLDAGSVVVESVVPELASIVVLAAIDVSEINTDINPQLLSAVDIVVPNVPNINTPSDAINVASQQNMFAAVQVNVPSLQIAGTFPVAIMPQIGNINAPMVNGPRPMPMLDAIIPKIGGIMLALDLDLTITP